MTTDEQAIRDELTSVEAELAQLRRGAAELREGLDGPTDAAEVAATLTAVEEQEALIAPLEAKREELLKLLKS